MLGYHFPDIGLPHPRSGREKEAWIRRHVFRWRRLSWKIHWRLCILLHLYARRSEGLSSSERHPNTGHWEAIVSLTSTVRILIATVSKEMERWWQRHPRFSRPWRLGNSQSTRHIPKNSPRLLFTRQNERVNPSIDQERSTCHWMLFHRRQEEHTRECDTEAKNGSGFLRVKLARRRRTKANGVLRECPARKTKERPAGKASNWPTAKRIGQFENGGNESPLTRFLPVMRSTWHDVKHIFWERTCESSQVFAPLSVCLSE